MKTLKRENCFIGIVSKVTLFCQGYTSSGGKWPAPTLGTLHPFLGQERPQVEG